MTLEEFEQQLLELIGRPTDLRPFICEGSPLDCEIFLVGLNPATSMDADFWSFWRPGYGYDKAAWYSRHLAERDAKPLKPGKRFQMKVSPTRRNIEAFVEGAGSVRVLETNIYAAASEEMSSLDPASRNIAPFSYLLDVIQPKVVVAHGSEANAVVSRLGFDGTILLSQHFSRGFEKEAARALGEQAANACLGG